MLLISVGELNENKNNQVIIKALGKIKDKNIHYILCGVGNKEAELKVLANKNGIAENVHFLGYRKDVKELMNASDIFVMPSFREGLSRSIMEAMASGLPCLVSRIRGNIDLVDEKKGGSLISTDNPDYIAEKIRQLMIDKNWREKMSEWNLKKVNIFDSKRVENIITKIYEEELLRGNTK